ncbi:hypothetical protein [Modestobacter italicus]|uniref:hypothetical protein n=1 Tax=Modestobacter italicus (strain DSM 44449 / CECT 9708 / BC 501) TaxID=2732864 RepID=UPI001C9436BB|nr:hypothetical protein [Modestobacter italicus]
MSHDPLTESLALIEHGLRSDATRLSRRRRSLAVAVDVDGDVACTLFVRRSVGYVANEAHLLERRGTAWHLLGGGGGGWPDDGLADRPAAEQLGALVAVRGGGSVLRGPTRRMPWGARYARYAQLRAGAEVHTVVVGAVRELLVPRHGNLVVVWRGRRPPSVTAHDGSGQLLGSVLLHVRTMRPVY